MSYVAEIFGDLRFVAHWFHEYFISVNYDI